jgi:hypothetical protein
MLKGAKLISSYYYLYSKLYIIIGISCGNLCVRKDITTGHDSIGPNLIILKTEVKNYVKLRRLLYPATR